MGALAQLDARLFLWINGTGHCAFLDLLLPLVTQFKLLALPLAAGWVALFWKGDRRTRVFLVVLLAAVGLSDLASSHGLKALVARPRPCHVLPANLDFGWVRFSCRKQGSMPSSHAANLACAAVLLGTRYRRWIPLFVAAALVVGYSRVYVGLHYPGDVLAGYALGAAIGGVVAWAARGFARTPADQR